MELNPKHPTTEAMRDIWYKLAAVLVNRSHPPKTVVTLEEVKRLEGKAITIKETAAGIELTVVSMAEAERLARQEGGLNL